MQKLDCLSKFKDCINLDKIMSYSKEEKES